MNICSLPVFFLSIRYIVITDTKENFKTISSVPNKWPKKYRNKITIEYLAESYPDNREDLRNLWRTCATQRLFVPAMLPAEEAIIYIGGLPPPLKKYFCIP